MSFALIFWLLMLLWALNGFIPTSPGQPVNYRFYGGHLLLFIVIALLGWKVFGAAIHS